MSATAVVVDASVWVSSLMPGEVHHATSQRWLFAHLGAGGRVIGPSLVLVEIAAAITRQSGDTLLGQRALNLMLELPALHLVGVNRQMGVHAAQVAADLHLRGADAVYVAVADQLRAPLVTWDQE